MQKLKVLMVDDEEELVFTVVERMNLRGIEAYGVVSGAEALNLMKQKTFNVVVLDVKMPGISGLKVMKQIKREFPNMPVILITGHGSVRDGEQGLQEGAWDYLPKPLQLEELIEKMKEAAKI